VIRCPAGDCILHHFPPTETLVGIDGGDPTSPFYLDNMLEVLLNPDDGDTANNGVILPVPERWGGDDADEVTLATFNCAAYAVGDLLDLHEGDWVDTASGPDTNETIPFKVVLDSYFKECLRIPAQDADWSQLANSAELHPNDLLCLLQQSAGKTEFGHVGRIRRHQDQNWLESKIGRGPIVLARLDSVAAAYATSFNTVLIFREK